MDRQLRERHDTSVKVGGPGRITGIEGLRALAALSVLIGHAWQFGTFQTSISDGWLASNFFGNLGNGLTLFFVLSGFLLYRPFVKALAAGADAPDTMAYLRNRALRILPAYWVILLFISVVVGVATLTADVNGPIGHLSPGLLAQNLVLFQNFTASGFETGIAPAWSLSVELVFYLLLPVLAGAGALLARRRFGRYTSMLIPAISLLILGNVCKVIAAVTINPDRAYLETWGNTWHAVFERSFLCQADLFSFGMIAAVVVVAVRNGDLAIKSRNLDLALVAAVATVILATLGKAAGVVGHRNYPLLLAAAFGLLIIYVVLSRSGENPVAKLLEKAPLVWVGTVSYSVYLWHIPVLLWLRENGWTQSGTAGFFLNLALLLALTLVLSAVTYNFVERPAMNRKREWKSKTDEASKELTPKELISMDEAAP